MIAQASTMKTDGYPVGVFTSLFTGKEAFLADHIIQGKKILPGMAYLEIARAAVAQSISVAADHVITLSDSIFVSALTVMDSCAVEVKVYPGAHGEFGVEVSSALGVHFQTKANVMSRHQLIQEQGIATQLDINALASVCTRKGQTPQQFYQTFKERDVLLGPSHRGVQAIATGNNEALITLALPGSSRRGMMMDPGMLDSIIQGGVALASQSEGNVVPFAVTRTLVLGPLTDKMYCHIKKGEKGLDYIACDEQGQVRVVIEGFLTREIDLNSQEDHVSFFSVVLEETSESIPADDIRELIVIRESEHYSDLVKTLLQTVKSILDDKTKAYLIEVQLAAESRFAVGVLSALKTIEKENSKIVCRLKLGDRLLDTRVVPLAIAPHSVASWRDGKTYLITGGMGGVGRLIASDMAQSMSAGHLILTGRRHLDDSDRAWLAGLNTEQRKVEYYRCDVSVREEVARLVQAVPTVNGVIHAAGTKADNLLINKTVDEIETVLAPKVDGTACLDEAFAQFDLDFFVAFSSIASVIGSIGQMDYSAANGYMDSYIRYRAELVKQRKRSGRSLSINWPLWEDGGMQLDDATKRNLATLYKVKPLPTAKGILALKQLLATDVEQAVVLFGGKKGAEKLLAKPVAVKTQKAERMAQDDQGRLHRELLQDVRRLAAEHQKMKPSQLDDTTDWALFGFDSIGLSSFINKVNMHFGLSLMPTVLFEATNIQSFSLYLTEHYSAQLSKRYLPTVGNSASVQPELRAHEEPVIAEVPSALGAFAQGFRKSYQSSTAYRDQDVAVVGMSCRIAGARNVDEFWQMLNDERDMVSEIPSDRWNWRDYPGVSKWGSFINGVDQFDSLFFGISPAEAMYMTPEQRLMIQYVWECIENAGCGGDDIRNTNTGLFVGCGPSGYSSILYGLPVEAYSATGTVASVGPNRINYFMDWHGPSHPIDTACSSALVALHRAVEAIRLGHCDQAIAGGVNLLLAPDGYISFAKSGMLCEDGRCKTFSDKANGYVRGEGVGMLMVKRLSHAIRDGNTIYAVVKGTAENHGGRTNSLTAPNPRSQAAVIKAAVKDAGIAFSRVGYIECHGTGTPLGDPVEISGLKMAAQDLLDEPAQQPFCTLGSIKSNIGHLEYAAGVVGLIKVILQIKHKKIAKSLHCETLNPYIDLKGTPFQIAQSASEWSVVPGQARVAGVSSFGFGGVNAHVILEEYLEQSVTPKQASESEANRSHILTVSAKNEDRLQAYVSELLSFANDENLADTDLRDIAYTLQIGRTEMPERVAFVVGSLAEWREQLRDFLASEGKGNNHRVLRGRLHKNMTGNIEIGDTKAGKEYIRQLQVANELEKLAELWVKGSKIDWQTFYR